MGYSNDQGGSSVINIVTQLEIFKFMQRLLAGLVTKIEGIGDSITAGVGATGQSYPAGNPIIFTDGIGTTYRESDYTNPSWFNFFRNYLNANYPGVTVVNRGIGGKSSKWWNQNKQYWNSSNADVVFVQLGTNDRFDCANAAEFETNLTELLSYIHARCKTMIVMTATPSLNDYDSNGVANPDYKFDMGVVDKVITKVCTLNGYAHISNYRMMLEFGQRSKTPMSQLLQGYQYGSHPMDKGYAVMWQGIQQQIGLIDSVKNWQDLSDGTIILDSSLISTTTPITSSLFSTIGRDYICDIPSNHADIANFPLASPGTIRYHKGMANDLYSYSEYLVRGTNFKYRRTWNNGGYWNPWSFETPYMKTANLTFAAIPANSIGVQGITLTGAAIGDMVSVVPGDSVTPGTPIEAGLMWSAFVSSANVVSVRLLNTTGSSITPVPRTWKVLWHK